MKRFAFVYWSAVILCCILGLCGCAKKLPDQTFYALDTVIELRQMEGAAQETVQQAQQRVMELENLLSCHKEGSDIWRINEQPYEAPVQIAPETYALLQRAKEISLKTEGRFDVTIKPLADLWNVKQAEKPPAEAEILRTMDRVGFPNLTLHEDGTVTRLSPDTQIDLGGMAKGMIADEVKKLLQEAGVQRGIIDLGGSITLIGEKEQGKLWTVGIKNPFQTGESYAKLTVADTSVVTSGGYERYFTYEGRDYHHIFDPYTGYPAEAGLKSVTVVSQDTALADALSTAAYVGGKERALAWAEEYGVEMVLVDTDKKVWITRGLRDKLTILDATFQRMEE